MKTDALIAMLATGGASVDRGAVVRRRAALLAGGASCAFLLMLLGQGLRPDLVQAIEAPMFWVKLVFPLTVAAVCLAWAVRLGRPGQKAAGVALVGLALPILMVWAVAAWTLVGVDAAGRWAMVLGETWLSCLFSIGALSVPIFVVAMLSMRDMAPTRLQVAGAAAGGLAGALGAAIYSLHCVETGAAFLAVWYVLGMAIPAGIGALAGPRLLRW